MPSERRTVDSTLRQPFDPRRVPMVPLLPWAARHGSRALARPGSTLLERFPCLVASWVIASPCLGEGKKKEEEGKRAEGEQERMYVKGEKKRGGDWKNGARKQRDR